MRTVKTIKEGHFKGKRVLIRVDFNVPLLDKGGKKAVGDPTRIEETLPTLKTLLQGGAGVAILTHLGRPKEKKQPEFSLMPVFEYLKTKLPSATPAEFVDDFFPVKKVELAPGSWKLFENVRFYPGEEKNVTDFAKGLASYGDVFVLDAFGTAHRAHASTEGVQHFLPSFAGLLIEKEVNFLEKVVHGSEKPFVAVLGGAKISGKIEVIENLLPKVDKILIGGAMAYTFLKARGLEIGKSLVENDKVELAKKLLASNKIELPVDHVQGEGLEAKGGTVVDTLSADKMGLDIGPKTAKNYQALLAGARLVFWNGPMGAFENPAFAEGTRRVAQAITESKCVSVVGGGDSVAAIEQFKLGDGFDHISTGGGASLEYVEGKTLPALIKLYK